MAVLDHDQGYESDKGSGSVLAFLGFWAGLFGLVGLVHYVFGLLT